MKNEKWTHFEKIYAWLQSEMTGKTWPTHACIFIYKWMLCRENSRVLDLSYVRTFLALWQKSKKMSTAWEQIPENSENSIFSWENEFWSIDLEEQSFEFVFPIFN